MSTLLPPLTLVLGGARSGKSAAAERLVTANPGPWTYIATAEALDDEMRERIARHRADRVPGWITIEEPLDLVGALRRGEGPALVECLTLWTSNLLHHGKDVHAQGLALLAGLPAGRPVVMVANEVGLGVVPQTPLGRRFRDAAGHLNQSVAARADRVLMMVAGLPLNLKG